MIIFKTMPSFKLAPLWMKQLLVSVIPSLLSTNFSSSTSMPFKDLNTFSLIMFSIYCFCSKESLVLGVSMHKVSCIHRYVIVTNFKWVAIRHDTSLPPYTIDNHPSRHFLMPFIDCMKSKLVE